MLVECYELAHTLNMIEYLFLLLKSVNSEECSYL